MWKNRQSVQYEWYLVDNLNYQAIPTKCGNIVSQRVSLIKQGHK